MGKGVGGGVPCKKHCTRRLFRLSYENWYGSRRIPYTDHDFHIIVGFRDRPKMHEHTPGDFRLLVFATMTHKTHNRSCSVFVLHSTTSESYKIMG